MTSVLVVVT